MRKRQIAQLVEKDMMNKLIENGHVAVLYSPDYGSGWSSWHGVEELLYDPKVVEMVRAEKFDEIEKYCSDTYGVQYYYGGLDGLAIAMIPEGTRFRISEYDGYETIILESEEDWFTA